MGSHKELLNGKTQCRMAVFSAMLVGTVCGVAVLGTTLLSLARRAGQPLKKRQRASVTEILQVDMVDRGLYYTATNIDCNLDMEVVRTARQGPGYSDQCQGREQCVQLQDVRSALQCTAVYCSVLQCTAVYCSVLQCTAVYYSVLQCTAVYCSVLQCTHTAHTAHPT